MKRTPYFHYITLAAICQALAVFFVSLIIATPVGAASNSSTSSINNFYFSDFTADYYLEPTTDGTKLTVKERITAKFPETNQNHGIERAIPFTNQGGLNLTAPTAESLHFTATRGGQPEQITQVNTKDDYYLFRLGDANSYVHGTQRYQLTYEFTNVVTDQNGFQELYWDTNGTGWSQRFDQLTANFHLDVSLINRLHADTWCYVGKQGSNNQSRCTTTQTDDGFTFTTSSLKPGENLTFVVNFNADTFIVPLPRIKPLVLICFCAAVIILLAILIYALITYYKYIRPKRRYYKNLFTPPQYTPAKGHTVADAAAIYLGSAKSPYVATLLELAVNHKIELVKDGKTWRIKIKSLTGLTSAQEAVLQILQNSDSLRAGDEFTIHQQSYSSTNALRASTFRTAPRAALTKQGFFEPAKRPGGIGVRMSRYASRTEKGLDLANYYQGLKDYIQLAEADRLKILQSVDGADTTPQGIVKIYEKLLPYAALFGLEKSWLATLGQYYEENPDLTPNWCTGAAIGYLSTRDFNTLSRSTASSYSSASISSSSSGSGGSGSSGGGGGGGGGGGW